MTWSSTAELGHSSFPSRPIVVVIDTDESVPAGGIDLVGVGLVADLECETFGIGFGADR